MQVPPSSHSSSPSVMPLPHCVGTVGRTVGSPPQGSPQAAHCPVAGSSWSAGHHETGPGSPPNLSSAQHLFWNVWEDDPVQSSAPMKHAPSGASVGEGVGVAVDVDVPTGPQSGAQAQPRSTVKAEQVPFSLWPFGHMPRHGRSSQARSQPPTVGGGQTTPSGQGMARRGSQHSDDVGDGVGVGSPAHGSVHAVHTPVDGSS
jgi:hypothetical protein